MHIMYVRMYSIYVRTYVRMYIRTYIHDMHMKVRTYVQTYHMYVHTYAYTYMIRTYVSTMQTLIALSDIIRYIRYINAVIKCARVE